MKKECHTDIYTIPQYWATKRHISTFQLVQIHQHTAYHRLGMPGNDITLEEALVKSTELNKRLRARKDSLI